MHDLLLLNHTLMIAAVQFVLGAIGVASRRNLAVTVLSAGLMLQGTVLSLTAFGTYHADWSGQVAAVVLLVLAMIIGGLVFVLAAGRRRLRRTDFQSVRTMSENADGLEIRPTESGRNTV